MNKKKTAKLFGAKKEVTKKDAKKLVPLSRYWNNKLNRDNWYILYIGMLLGFLLGLIV